MSMARNRNPHDGVGHCYFHGPPAGVGLPITLVEDRPLVVVHPAAAINYTASFGLLEHIGHPFIHFMVDWGNYAPDDWGVGSFELTELNYQRLADTVHGHPTYRNTALRTPHWQVHAVGEAYETLTKMPPVDVLYVDWLEWMAPNTVNREQAFVNMMASFVHKIRQGGLVIVDHKNSTMSEGQHPWFAYPEDDFFHVVDQTFMAKKGPVDWLSTNIYGDLRSHHATVFEVVHAVDSELGLKDWDTAMLPWCWGTVPEMSLTTNQLQTLLDLKMGEHHHPKTDTFEKYMDRWLRVMDDHGPPQTILGHRPPIQGWPDGAYAEFLQWLIDHPACTSGDLEKRTYTMLGEMFKLHIVHGDLTLLAPSLWKQHAMLAVRAPLKQQVVARCPWWLGQALELQSDPAWMGNPVKDLQWSGPNATPMLAKTMLELAKTQPYSRAFPSIKSMQVNHIVTVAHGSASLGEVMKAVKAYHDTLPPMMARAPMEMTIVCLDEDDYTDVQTVPPYFQFLPNDGSCID